MIKHIVIAGTGFGGWYTALSLLNNIPDIQITIIGSSEIPKLRVGESLGFDSPYNLKRLLGFEDDRVFMRATGSIYKYGTVYDKINNNHDTQYVYKTHNLKVGSLTKFFSGFDYADFHEPWNFRDGDTGVQQVWLWDHQQNPKTWNDYANEMGDNAHFLANPVAPYNINNQYILRPNDGYSYHMDADRTAELIKSVALEKYSDRIKCVDDVIIDIQRNNNNIAGLLLRSGNIVSGDVYCDLTGVRHLLMTALNNTTWKTSNDYSCNSALVFPTPYSDPENQIIGSTRFNGADHGWKFRINLYHRAGNGYVYRDDLITKDQALESLQKDFGDKIKPMHLSWNPGYFEKPWIGNAVAMGAASNFISPFDANVVSTHSRSIENLISVIKNQSFDESYEDQFNKLQLPVNDELDYRLRTLFGFSSRSGPYWELARQMAKEKNLLELIEDIVSSKFKHINERVTWNWSHQHFRILVSCGVDISKFNLEPPTDKDLEMSRAYWNYMTARNKYIKNSVWPNYYTWLKDNRFDGRSSREMLEELNPDLA